jgi:hypothetical protein
MGTHWRSREARAQSRRELEVGLALVRRRNALVNEYRRVTYLLMLSYDIGCQWRLNVRHRLGSEEEGDGNVYCPVV